MADPIVLPLEQDPTAIEQEIYSYIQSFYPEWDPKEPHVLVMLSEAIAAEVADLRRLATDVGPEILIYWGNLLGVTAIEAQPAVGAVNIEMVDNAGYTIPLGTEMRILIQGDEYMGFETTEEFTVAPGQTVASAVPIVATSNGTAGNGLTSAPELLDILDYIDSVALVGSTTDGIDAELIDDYLARLRTRLQLLADRPIVPRDFEIYAETVVPGIYRSLCVDGYNPVDSTYNNERMVAMAAIDENGNGVSDITQQTMKDALEAVRELTFVVNTIDPTYTAVTVNATLVAMPGWDKDALQATATEEVRSFLDPANFGKPTIGTGETRRWIRSDKVRYGELMWVLRRTEGTAYIEGAIIINGVANTDLTLAGAAPLPAHNPTINITVI